MLYNPFLWLFGVSLFATMTTVLALKRVWNQYEKLVISSAFLLVFVIAFIFIADKTLLLSWFKVLWFVGAVAAATFVSMRAPFLILKIIPSLLFAAVVLLYSPLNLKYRNLKNNSALELSFSSYKDSDENIKGLLLVSKEFTQLTDWSADKAYIMIKNEYVDPRVFWLNPLYSTYIAISDKPYQESFELATDVTLFNIPQQNDSVINVQGFSYNYIHFEKALIAEPRWEYKLIRTSINSFVLEDS